MGWGGGGGSWKRFFGTHTVKPFHGRYFAEVWLSVCKPVETLEKPYLNALVPQKGFDSPLYSPIFHTLRSEILDKHTVEVESRVGAG